MMPAMILAHDALTSGAAPPARWMLFLHGILGRRANWRSFARKWLARRPGWGALLVDLRDHGESQGLPGPRTIEAAGGDLVPLAEAVARERGGRVAGVLGHSFGGKVAISGATQLRAAGRGLDELWVIDAPPGRQGVGRERITDHVFAALARLPERFAERGEFVELVQRAGISKPVAQWLATNLVELPEDSGDGWRFGLDLERITALRDDFGIVDLWPALEAEAEAGARTVLVLGERSEAVVGEDLARAKSLADAGILELAWVPDAGHWVHTDNPAALLEILADASPELPPSNRGATVAKR
jgi:esterase